MLPDEIIQLAGHPRACQRAIHTPSNCLSPAIIHDAQHAKPLPVLESLRHKAQHWLARSGTIPGGWLAALGRSLKSTPRKVSCHSPRSGQYRRRGQGATSLCTHLWLLLESEPNSSSPRTEPDGAQIVIISEENYFDVRTDADTSGKI